MNFTALLRSAEWRGTARNVATPRTATEVFPPSIRWPSAGHPLADAPGAGTSVAPRRRRRPLLDHDARRAPDPEHHALHVHADLCGLEPVPAGVDVQGRHGSQVRATQGVVPLLVLERQQSEIHASESRAGQRAPVLTAAPDTCRAVPPCRTPIHASRPGCTSSSAPPSPAGPSSRPKRQRIDEFEVAAQ